MRSVVHAELEGRGAGHVVCITGGPSEKKKTVINADCRSGTIKVEKDSNSRREKKLFGQLDRARGKDHPLDERR